MRAIYFSTAVVALVIVSTIRCFGQPDYWTRTNGPYIGDFTAVAVNPNGLIFAGANNGGINIGGLFRSADIGITWMRISNGLDDIYYVGSIVFSTNGDVYIATSNGVYKSSDEGDSWIRGGLTSHTISLVINQNGDLFAGTYWSGLYRSTNSGLTWSQLTLGGNSIVYSLAIKPDGKLFAARNGDGVFRSIDNGNSWTPMNTGFLDTTTIALGITRNGSLLAGNNSGAIYRSTNDGDSWARVALLASPINSFVSDSSNNLFAGTYNGIFKSTDDGQTWSSIGLGGTRITSLATHSAGNIFAGAQFSGIFLSTDQGGSWDQAYSGLTREDVTAITVTSTGEILASLYLGGVYASTNHGSSWIQRGLPMYIVNQFAITPSQTIFAIGRSVSPYYEHGIYHSSDHGFSWVEADSGLPEFSYITCIATNPNGVLLAGTEADCCVHTGGIYRSSNNGAGWTRIAFPDTGVHSLFIDETGYILAGVSFWQTGNGGLFRSTDGGDSWHTTTNGLPDPIVGVTSFTLNASGSILAAIDASYDSDIYRSTDHGENWEAVNSGIPTSSLSLSQFAVAHTGEIFVATRNAGVYHTTDGGTLWSQLSSGLTSSFIRCVAIDSIGFVYAGSDTAGMFRSLQTLTAVPVINKELPAKFALEQNFPNPFNAETRIHFELPYAGTVRLAVYDLLGRELVTLLDEFKVAGSYDATFNAANLASGTYFYRLQAGSFTIVKKSLVLR